MAFAVESTSWVAPTRTAPLPPARVSDGALVARFLISIQLNEIAAATPTLPPELPDWLEDELLPLDAWLCAVGAGPGVLPVVFELLLTWLLD